MNELRVLFAEAAGQGYRAQLADARGRRLGVEVPFSPFLTEEDYEDLRWYLEEYMDLPDGGAVIRAQRIEKNLDEWGRRLYEVLFAVKDNREFLRDLLEGPEPRRLTIASRDPALLRLPWELMADKAGSLAQRLSVRRQLEEPETTTPRSAQLPLRILYIVSRPTDAGFIDPRFTAKSLLDALDPLGANVRVDFCRPPTLARTEEMLREEQAAGDPYHIIHFDGHGTFLPGKQIGGLLFEKPGAPTTEFVVADRLGEVLASHTVSLVILEACRSATVGKDTVLGSVAPYLIQAGVGSVLAMSHAVHVDTTRLLLASFYRELVRGATIGQAVAVGRAVLRSMPARWIEPGPVGRTIELCDWFLPQLYQSAADEALVPSGAEADSGRAGQDFRSPATGDEPGSFPPPPQFGFRGGARELHILERRFRACRGLVLHAMGGMGKTALATEAAHWWTRSGLFREGACFLSLEHFTSADRVVRVLGTYLAGPLFGQLPAAQQRRRVIELFQKQAVLMVWDNFESVLPQFNDGAAPPHGIPYTDHERHHLAELFRDLTAGPGKGCLLVTCRPGETGLPGAQGYELEGLARTDSLWLLASILRRDGLTLNDPRLSREKLDPLLRDLADHPLSLELVGPHLRHLTPEEIRADFGRLLAKFQQEAPEERNQSLLASLEYSRRHLSPAACEALPWLGLFSGGVFEVNLLLISQLPQEAWKPIRQELQGVALLRTEDDLGFAAPYLRFHPTLASAAADLSFAQNPEVRQRFLSAYSEFTQVMDRAMKSSQPRIALKILNREETNCHTAIRWAIVDQQFRSAAMLGSTFSDFLQMSGRLQERDAWIQWLNEELGQQGFTEESAVYERLHAWARFTQGDPEGALDQLQSLVERLRHATSFDPAFQLAQAVSGLGRLLNEVGASAQAIPILRDAVGLSEALVERAEGRPWPELLSSPDIKAASALDDLFANMGDLANALNWAGQRDEALAIAEKCLEFEKIQGNYRSIAVAHGCYASILSEMGRYEEADAHYDLALAAARQAGDKELEGVTLQHQGALAQRRNQLQRAGRCFKWALRRFQESGDHKAQMQTYHLLGLVEQKAGRLGEARAWHQKSRDLAMQLKDQVGLSAAILNIGSVYREESKIARERGEESAARHYLEEALRSVEESLKICQALGNKPIEADPWSQLAEIHLLRGDLAAAECHAHEARQIRESLGIKEVVIDYNNLSDIALARGDIAAAAEWAQKCDDLLAELVGGGTGGGDSERWGGPLGKR